MDFKTDVEKTIVDPIRRSIGRVASLELRRFKGNFKKLIPKDGSTILAGNDKPVLELFRRLSVCDKTDKGFEIKIIPVPVVKKNLSRLEKGYKVLVTHKVQRYLARKGLFVRVGTTLSIPGRAIFNTGGVVISKHIEQDIVKLIEKEL